MMGWLRGGEDSRGVQYKGLAESSAHFNARTQAKGIAITSTPERGVQAKAQLKAMQRKEAEAARKKAQREADAKQRAADRKAAAKAKREADAAQRAARQKKTPNNNPSSWW